MLRNYISTGWRNIRRNSGSTWINIAGLTLGITCSIALFQLMQFALQYNLHHENRESIYRVVTEDTIDGTTDTTPGVPSPLPDALRSDVGGIHAAVFIHSIYQQMLLGVEKEGLPSYHEVQGEQAYVEPEYFDIFTRPLAQGSLEKFAEPFKVVISEKMKERLFGAQADVIGAALTLNKKDVYEVIAVMKDYPVTSDFPFDIFYSYATIKDEYIEESGWGSVTSDDHVYILLENGVEPARIDSQLVDFVPKHFGEDKTNVKRLFLQPLTELHYDERFSNYSYRTVTYGDLTTMGIIAFFLILTASVNFINLATALATRRARETGIRKVLGGQRSQLVFQFMGETFIVVLVSMILSLGLAEVLIIQMNKLLDTGITITYSLPNVLFFFGILIFVTVLAGFYPALVLSGYKPAEALRSKLSVKREGLFSLRKGLVTTQFFISQLFIIGTIILLSQLEYMHTLDLGYNADAVLNIPLPDDIHSKKRSLKSEILKIPGVQGASLIFTTPVSGSVSVTNIKVEGNPENYHAAIKIGDEDYLDLYGIEVLRGEGLTNSDTVNRIVVNEEWLKETGQSIDEVVGMQVDLWGASVPVAGVVRNFHTMSLRNGLQPIMIMSGLQYSRSLSIRISMANAGEILGDIEEEWKKFYPEYTYDFAFVDESVAEMYESEEQMGKMLSFFSFVAIGIGCLGLLGLIAYTTNRRTKEIGVRKVHGASVTQIFSLISGDIMRLVLVAFVFSAPLSWYLMSRWLENYEYRISVNGWFLLVGLLITVFIALATIAYRSWKAAAANPAVSLRSE